MSGGLVNGSPVLLRSLVLNGGVVPENELLVNESEVIELAEPPLHVILGPRQLMPEHPLHETHYVIDEVSFCSASLLGHFERRISNHMPINLGAGIGAKAVACYEIKYMSKNDMLGARL